MLNLLSALEFPPISELVEFPPLLFEGTAFEFNKIALICFLSMGLTLTLFLVAGSKKQLVPRGIQSVMESSVDFIRNGIIDQTMPHGQGAEKWLPYLTTVFFFILFCNLTSIFPLIYMPASARMAIPLFLSLFTWVLFVVTGFVKQGFGYLKEVLFPPGVPAALYILVTPIEFISTFLVRPFSLAVRLFANTLAGHILLATFSILAMTLIKADTLALKPIFVLPGIMLILLTGFELLVGFLQAYIFTILTAVYIGGAMHPEH